MIVAGRVKRFRFQKGYFVIADIDASEAGVVRTVLAKGDMPGVYEGDNVRLEGRYESHPKWGKQFKIRECYRQERSGVESVLEMMPEVGPARAAQIREAFGDTDVFKMIEDEPERLLVIPGLTETRIATIREACLERKADRELLLWCGENGISSHHAGLIRHKFERRALEILQKAPYDIITATGIGFPTADRIARRVGADANGIERAKAAILFVMREAESADGSTVVEAPMLMAALRGHSRGPDGRATAVALSPPLDDDATYEALSVLVQKRELFRGGANPVLIQRGLTRAVERQVANQLAALALNPAEPPPERPGWRDRSGGEPDDDLEIGGLF